MRKVREVALAALICSHLALPGGGEVPGLHDESAPAHVLLLGDLEVRVQRGQRGVQTRPGGQPLLQGPTIWLRIPILSVQTKQSFNILYLQMFSFHMPIKAIRGTLINTLTTSILDTIM